MVHQNQSKKVYLKPKLKKHRKSLKKLVLKSSLNKASNKSLESHFGFLGFCVSKKTVEKLYFCN